MAVKIRGAGALESRLKKHSEDSLSYFLKLPREGPLGAIGFGRLP
jgi:hypothetical protein